MPPITNIAWASGKDSGKLNRCSLHYSHTQNIDVDEGSDKNLELYLSWICQHGCLLVTIHINCILINFVYLTACPFIRSWWHCTIWMTSSMMLNRKKKSIIKSYLLVWRINRLGKLINRIQGLRLLISSLPGSAWGQLLTSRGLNGSASLTMSTSVL